jgi:hypothetical protein
MSETPLRPPRIYDADAVTGTPQQSPGQLAGRIGVGGSAAVV